MSQEKIDALVEAHTKAELQAMAKKAGLEYQNNDTKSMLASAIVNAGSSAPSSNDDGGVMDAANGLTGAIDCQIAALTKAGSKNRVRKLQRARRLHMDTMRILNM